MRETSLYTESMVFLMVECLFSATHKEREIDYAGQPYTLKPGQFVFGRIEWAKRLKINESTLYKRVTKLKKFGFILEIKSNSFGGTIYQIDKWNEYQPREQPSNSLVTAKEQLGNTNKNVKNVKNVKKEIHTNNFSKFESLTENVIKEVCSHYKIAYINGKEIAEDLRLYCQSNGKTYKNYKAALENWIRRRIKDNPDIIIKVLEEDEIYKLPATDRGTEGVDRGNLEKIKELRKQFDSKRFDSPF